MEDFFPNGKIWKTCDLSGSNRLVPYICIIIILKKCAFTWEKPAEKSNKVLQLLQMMSRLNVAPWVCPQMCQGWKKESASSRPLRWLWWQRSLILRMINELLLVILIVYIPILLKYYNFLCYCCALSSGFNLCLEAMWPKLTISP